MPYRTHSASPENSSLTPTTASGDGLPRFCSWAAGHFGRNRARAEKTRKSPFCGFLSICFLPFLRCLRLLLSAKSHLSQQSHT